MQLVKNMDSQLWCRVLIELFEFVWIDDLIKFRLASVYGHKDVAQILVDNKADVNKQDDKYKYSALSLGKINSILKLQLNWKLLFYVAALHGHKDIIYIILAHKADLNARDADGSTALMNGMQSIFHLINLNPFFIFKLVRIII